MKETRASAPLAAEGLAFARGARWLFRDLSLHLAPGDAVAIIGRNGMGKSTLLRVLGGLLPSAAGGLSWSGKEASALAPPERARLVSYMGQSLQAYPGFQVREFLALAFARALWDAGAAKLLPVQEEAIARATQLFELAPLLARPLVELSGGEWRRVQLARAVAQDGPLLLLDEPETSLDPGHLQALVAILLDERRRGRALALSSHRLGFLQEICNRGLILDDGICPWQGTLDDPAWPALSRAAFRLDRPWNGD